MVEMLVLEPAVILLGVTVGEDEERRPLEPGACDAVGHGRRAGSKRGQARRRMTRQVGLHLCRDGATRFSRCQDEAQAGTSGRIDEIEVAAAAGHAEQRAHTCRAEARHDGVGDGRHKSLMVLRYDSGSQSEAAWPRPIFITICARACATSARRFPTATGASSTPRARTPTPSSKPSPARAIW